VNISSACTLESFLKNANTSLQTMLLSGGSSERRLEEEGKKKRMIGSE
jgi:hypothetical protein